MFNFKLRLGVVSCCVLYFCVAIGSFSEGVIVNDIASSPMFFPISISKGESSVNVGNVETSVYNDENKTLTKIIRKYLLLDELIFPFSNGLRQDFVLYGKLSGNSPLQINLGFSGKIVEVLPQSVCFQDKISNRLIQYSNLNVFDRTGRRLLSHFAQITKDSISIIVEDSGAVYPIYVDPTYLNEDWESMSPNWSEGEISSIVIDSNNNVYCGGNFSTINGVSAKRVAKWNGSVWQQMGNGFADGAVEKMCISPDNTIYAVGSFTKQSFTYYNHVAKWTGSNWAVMGSGFDNVVYAVTITNTGTVYAGGKFTESGETQIKHIAYWDGAQWEEPYSGVSDDNDNSYVRALTSDSSGNVYVGGLFQYAGYILASNIACWNGTSWSALDSGVNGEVCSLAVDSSGKLYVGGSFTQAGGVSVNNIAIWDGTAWSSPNGGGVNGIVYAILPQTAQSIFIGGNFSVAGGNVTSNGLAWLYSSNWKEITSGVAGATKEVRALALDSQGNLYAGGDFHTVGGIECIGGIYSYKIAKLKKPPVFTLNYSADTGGTISGASSQSIMRGDDGTEVMAVAENGYMFDHWSDDVTTPNRTDTNITENKSVTAYFSSNNEGITEGEGSSEGEVINEGEGTLEGTLEGEIEGTIEGTNEGILEGEGAIEGTMEGETEGTIEGIDEGILEGEGMVEGTNEGEGTIEGETGLVAWIEGNNYVNRTVGDSFTFSVQVEGAYGEVGYQWYYCKNYNCSNPVTFQQELEHELYIEDLGVEDTGWYWCQVSDDFGVVETQRVYLQVTHGLSISVPFLSSIIFMFCLFCGYFYSKIEQDRSKDCQD